MFVISPIFLTFKWNNQASHHLYFFNGTHVLHPYGTFKKYWNVCILLLLVYEKIIILSKTQLERYFSKPVAKFRQNPKFIQNWVFDNFMIFFYACMALPVTIAWDTELNFSNHHGRHILTIVSLLGDITLLLDMVLTFRTSFKDTFLSKISNESAWKA